MCISESGIVWKRTIYLWFFPFTNRRYIYKTICGWKCRHEHQCTMTSSTSKQTTDSMYFNVWVRDWQNLLMYEYVLFCSSTRLCQETTLTTFSLPYQHPHPALYILTPSIFHSGSSHTHTQICHAGLLVSINMACILKP